jgi:uncharacterized protein DUF6328
VSASTRRAQRTLPSGCDDTWNAGQRGETPLKRADRNFADLLQELRVAQTGVQILFAFLLGLAFTDRFAELGDTERGIYIATLAACALTEALLVAPVMLHRLLFQCGLKRELVWIGHRFIVAGAVRTAFRDRGRAAAGNRSVLRWLRRRDHWCGDCRSLHVTMGRTRATHVALAVDRPT